MNSAFEQSVALLDTTRPVPMRLDVAASSGSAKFDELNSRLSAVSALAGFNQALASGQLGALNLTGIIAADIWKESLTLGLGAVHAKVDDAVVEQIALMLNKGLQTLELYACKKVTDVGVAALVSSFPETLRRLDLTFAYMTITDSGVSGIAGGLPSGLEGLTLNFGYCEEITDLGASFLASQPWQTLDLNFEECTMLTDTGVSGIAGGLPSGLKSLKLNFSICREITDAGVTSLASKLPAGLQVLEIDFGGCIKIGETGLTRLAAALPRTLLQLKVCDPGQLGESGLNKDAFIPKYQPAREYMQ